MSAKSASQAIQAALTRKQNEVATAIYEEVTAATPKESGRLRAGWRMERGRVNRSKPPIGKYADPTTPAIAPAVPGQDNRIFISNAVPYVLEANEGHSDQAPSGFVDAAITRAVNKAK